MKLGLVLAGGGGKGGYEIGVWKYLREIGLDKKISVISGTSVGGLNAVLMANGDYQTAEYIWTNEINNTILDKESSQNKDGALFSRDGLLNIIDKHINLNFLKDTETKVYVTSFNMDSLRAESHCLNYYEPNEIKTLLCATSAIPIVFQKEKFKSKKYIDGGITDNVPLSPLIKEKCTHAIIVYLRDDIHMDYSGFDIKPPIVLRPSSNLGIISGITDFSHERAAKRIQIGYSDCKNKYNLLLRSYKEDNVDNWEQRAKEINEMNNNTVLLETLKIISAKPELVQLIQVNVNLDMGTMGGKVWWKDLAEYDGWRFQQRKVGIKQVRLLDKLNNRKIWGKYQAIVDVCRDFLQMRLKEEQEANNNDVESRLKKLQSLKDKGLINDEDYNKRKDEILCEI